MTRSDPRVPSQKPSLDEPATAPQEAFSPTSLTDQIEQNLENMVALRRREWEQSSPAQRRLERISRFVGRPSYLIAIVVFVAGWIVTNVLLAHFGTAAFDPSPFSFLQGLLTIVALLTTTVVLIAQNRQARLEQHHSHLDLQVNLLTEQKVSKLILLIEELRRDLPMVRDRHDPEAAVLQQAADTAEVLSAIEEVGLTQFIDEPPPPTTPSDEKPEKDD